MISIELTRGFTTFEASGGDLAVLRCPAGLAKATFIVLGPCTDPGDGPDAIQDLIAQVLRHHARLLRSASVEPDI